MTMENAVGIDEDIGLALADELLGIRCQLGEPGAMDALVERWHPSLWRYVRGLASDDDAAAEAVQDVWLRVVHGISRLREPARLRAWLFGIARRVMMDRLRQAYAEPERAELDLTEVAAPDDTDDRTEDLAQMRDALSMMPVTERDALVLFYLKELTLAQMAEVLAVPVGTVKSRLFRARRLLRRTLTDRGLHL
ncbi:MAG: sigma-70 family RNA polymerase sigma factor [Gemmatimonadota bacterium]